MRTAKGLMFSETGTSRNSTQFVSMSKIFSGHQSINGGLVPSATQSTNNMASPKSSTSAFKGSSASKEVRKQIY